jgi:hypothetical protein
MLNDDLDRPVSSSRSPAPHRAAGGAAPERAFDTSGTSPDRWPPGQSSGDEGEEGVSASAGVAPSRPTNSSDHDERVAWLMQRVGEQLAKYHPYSSYHPHALGAAFGVLLAKLAAPPGSPAHRWAYTHSPVKHPITRTFEDAMLHELNAAAYCPPDTLGPTYHDRRGRPLDEGYDALVVVRALIERGVVFPPGLFREGDLRQLAAFTEHTDAELEAEWRVPNATVRKRRQRLRKRMVTILEVVRGGSVEAPTIIERLARVEERVREHDRQLGLVGNDEAAETVETLLSEIQEDDAA